VTTSPTIGDDLLVVTVQVGAVGAAGDCHVTVVFPGALLPAALLPTTENVFRPAVADDATHVTPFEAQPVHA